MYNKFIKEKISAIENSNFTHIIGPNPLLVTGETGSWDDDKIELCDIFKDNGKYYLYYHAMGNGESYRIGVAVADNPLGPFVKYENNPILDLENFGQGNDKYIACGSVFKESTDKYYLFYSTQQIDDPWNYYIGLATADNPLGPWKKHKNSPILKNFGYVGGITKKDGKYYMFNEYPTKVQADDYGSISLAVADFPEGPWTICKENPVLKVENWGTWDDAGYSECGVKFDGNLFHMFYGGAKTHPTRLCSMESIGYAYSVDGTRFIKYSKNHVAHRENIAFGAAMAEVCHITEYPYIYLYHTLRYTKAWRDEDKEKFPFVEHIGVEILSVTEKFNVNYQAFSIKELAENELKFDTSKLPITVSPAKEFSLTVSCEFSKSALNPLKVYIFSGYDENNFDTKPLYTLIIDAAEDKKVQQTFYGKICTKFIKIAAENTNSNACIKDIKANIMLKN